MTQLDDLLTRLVAEQFIQPGDALVAARLDTLSRRQDEAGDAAQYHAEPAPSVDALPAGDPTAVQPDAWVRASLALAIRAVRSGSTALALDSVGTLSLEGHAEDVVTDLLSDPSAAGADSAATSSQSTLAERLSVPRSDELTQWLGNSALARLGIIRVEFGLLYLDRYWTDERFIANMLADRRTHTISPADVDAGMAAVAGQGLDDAQLRAVRSVLTSSTTVLTGGPGMGKTHTVARVLEAVHAGLGSHTRIALAAPTGKAAARMTESLRQAGVEVTSDAQTLHRLLGFRPDNHQRFRYNRLNPLPHDVVIVDEASMVSLSMMARLLEALKPSSRLLLVGDPAQLASVEAGSVLGDFVDGLSDEVVRLTTNHRLRHGRATLAHAFTRADPDAVLAALDNPNAGVTFVETEEPNPAVLTDVVASAIALRDAALTGDADAAIDCLAASRLLCAHRTGPYGTGRWNRMIEAELAAHAPDVAHHRMYVGRPILITKNDRGLGLFNGDTGVIIARDGELIAAIETAQGVREFSPWRLGDIETMHAMTVHKAQGSQARNVTVIVPPLGSPLLTREMLYTAVTRAQEQLTVIGAREAIVHAVRTPITRASGLRQRLATQPGLPHQPQENGRFASAPAF